jgi:uncharacterized repeat protein (TIGR02543 family)
MEWTVTFETNLGSPVQSQELDTGDLVTAPENVTKQNYVLLGWYSDTSFNNKWDFETDTVSSDLTLYAKWRLTLAAKLKEILLGIREDINTKIPLAEKAEPLGVATLDAEGKVPIEQINAEFDQVIISATTNDFPEEGSLTKLYIAEDTKKVYRWDGTAYRVASNQTFLSVTQPDYMIEGDIWFKED